MIKDCLGREVKKGDFVLYAKSLVGGNPVMAYGRVEDYGVRKYSVLLQKYEKEVLLIRTPTPVAVVNDPNCLQCWKADKIVKWSKEHQLFIVDNPPKELTDQFEEL